MGQACMHAHNASQRQLYPRHWGWKNNHTAGVCVRECSVLLHKSIDTGSGPRHHRLTESIHRRVRGVRGPTRNRCLSCTSIRGSMTRIWWVSLRRKPNPGGMTGANCMGNRSTSVPIPQTGSPAVCITGDGMGRGVHKPVATPHIGHSA